MDYVGAVPDYSVTGGFPQIGDFKSSQGFSEVARPHSGGLLCDSSGLASYAAPPILAQSLSPIPRVVPGPVLHQGKPPLCHVCGPLDSFSPVSTRCTVGTDLQEEGGHHRRLQLGLGYSVGGQSGILLLVSPGAMPAYQLPRAVGCFPGPDSHKGAPYPGPVRQHDGGSLHQPPRRSQVLSSLQDGSTPPIVGTEQTPLAKSGSCARQFEPRCGHAVQRQCSSGGMDFNPQNGSENLICLPDGSCGAFIFEASTGAYAAPNESKQQHFGG